MKNLLFAFLLAILTPFTLCADKTQDPYYGLTQTDYEALCRAINMVDEGMPEYAQVELDRLAATYPKNYLVLYERLYALARQGRYAEITADAKKMLKFKQCTDKLYQLLSIAYAKSDDMDNAWKVLEKGFKKFPRSAILWQCAGDHALMKEDYNTAYSYYLKGIDYAPEFMNNYKQAATLAISSDNSKVWGLVYAETALLLGAWNDIDKHEYLSALLRNGYVDNIRFSVNADSIRAKLAPQRNMSVDKESNIAYLDFTGIYEGCMDCSLRQMVQTDTMFVGNIEQLSRLRKGIVDVYYDRTDNLYGDSMHLLQYHKSIIEAGHWEAFNYYLFAPLFPEEWQEWYERDSSLIEEFAKWYKNNYFSLTETRTVSQSSIYSHYPNINLIAAIMIQGLLIKEDPELMPQGKDLLRRLKNGEDIMHGD